MTKSGRARSCSLIAGTINLLLSMKKRLGNNPAAEKIQGENGEASCNYLERIWGLVIATEGLFGACPRPPFIGKTWKQLKSETQLFQ